VSEPTTSARSLLQVAPGVLRWQILDERINAPSDAYAIVDGGEVILIDPLPLSSGAQASLARRGKVTAICLTGAFHQRSAWRYRSAFGAKVYGPRGGEGFEEKPDILYKPGDTLPGGLLAVHTPGPASAHYAFLLTRGAGVLFCADLLANMGAKKGGLRFIESEYQEDPARTRRSVKKLLELPFRVACFAHGAPITRLARKALAGALERDANLGD
jgi:glyoxylase-like metal-dependent hydrolase (beta-lactamase superfamily II)